MTLCFRFDKIQIRKIGLQFFLILVRSSLHMTVLLFDTHFKNIVFINWVLVGLRTSFKLHAPQSY